MHASWPLALGLRLRLGLPFGQRLPAARLLALALLPAAASLLQTLLLLPLELRPAGGELGQLLLLQHCCRGCSCRSCSAHALLRSRRARFDAGRLPERLSSDHQHQ